MPQTPTSAALPTELPMDIDGIPFTLRVFPDPSGLRGQVFLGEEKVAGVQVFHTGEIKRLVAKARGNSAVLRAVAARTGSPA